MARQPEELQRLFEVAQTGPPTVERDAPEAELSEESLEIYRSERRDLLAAQEAVAELDVRVR